MKYVSPIYSLVVPSTPINKQAATGCCVVGTKYDEKPFHPLAGKGCLKWALKNCREAANITDMVYKIAEGCSVSKLEVIDMVHNWLDSGRAVWRDGKLKLLRNKNKITEEEKSDFTRFFLVAMKVSDICEPLKGKILKVPEFYIGNLGRGVYEVAVDVDGHLISFTSWVNTIVPCHSKLTGNLRDVTCAVLYLKENFGYLVGLEEKRGGCARVYGLTNLTKDKMALIKSMIRPTK